MRLAEQLGAETVFLSGQHVAEEIVKYARSRGVTRIVVGKAGPSRWRDWLRHSLVHDLVRESGDIELHIIRGREEPAEEPLAAPAARRFVWRPYGWTAAIMGLCLAVAEALKYAGLAETNVVMMFLLGVLLVAVRYGRGPGIAASVLAVLLFDFFLVQAVLHLRRRQTSSTC